MDKGELICLGPVRLQAGVPTPSEQPTLVRFPPDSQPAALHTSRKLPNNLQAINRMDFRFLRCSNACLVFRLDRTEVYFPTFLCPPSYSYYERASKSELLDFSGADTICFWGADINGCDYPHCRPAAAPETPLRQAMLDSADFSRHHEAEPKAALEALLHHNGTLLLDLDETAYLSNSTEDFLDSASPGIAALLLLRLLDAIRPWRWTGGEATRDLWRVRLVSAFIPWIGILWRRRVKSLAAQFANQPLL